MAGSLISLNGGVRNVTIVGSLSKTAAGTPVTSDVCTIAGNGTIRFESVVDGGAGSPEYSLAGGAWTTFGDGTTLAVLDAQTFQVRCPLPAATSATFSIINNPNNKAILGGTLTRT